MSSVSPPATRQRTLQLCGTILLLSVVALLPWSRNHRFLTDFYDYGLVISGVGRIEAGERLYADFVSPFQSGIFLLNGLAEKSGGGGFQAMTLGAAYFIAFATAALVLCLAQRWSVPGAAALALGIVFCSVSQHTIIWHNTLGVVCLAAATWSVAIAPVWRRRHLPWHLIAVAGLWFGGMNKLNFHLVALAVACGWTIRAGLTGGERCPRVIGTLAGWLVAGVILPLVTELLLTGASLAEWRHNVIELPLASRAGNLTQLATLRFYLASPHVYYGALRLPQIGLVSALLPLVAGGAIWRSSARPGIGDKIVAGFAVALAVVAGAALHATNNEIGYVALAAALVLTTGLWLGFAIPARGPVFCLGLAIPSILVGSIAWESAWRGQRSQFGHSSSPRETFLPAENAAPEFTYLRGTLIPPEMHRALGDAAVWLKTIERGGLHPVFYGPGVEWLERVFPAVKPGPMPLLAQWGTTYGPQEFNRLHRGLRDEHIYPAVLSVHAWDSWTKETETIFNYLYARSSLGGLLDLRLRSGQVPELVDAINFANSAPGNVAATHLDFAGTSIGPYDTTARKAFLGVTRETGRLSLRVPIRRMESEAVIRRVDQTASSPCFANFRAENHRSQETRWSARLELGAGQGEAFLPFTIDGDGEPLDLVVTIPPEFQDQIAAGFHQLRVTHTGEDPGPAPYLRSEKFPDEEIDATPGFADGWTPDRMTMRGGNLAGSAVKLYPGGELWLYSDAQLTELSGEMFQTSGSAGGSQPVVRIVWYKAGRLQVLQQEGLEEPAKRTHFRAWSAEPHGWIGLLSDPGAGRAAVTIQIDHVAVAPQ